MKKIILVLLFCLYISQSAVQAFYFDFYNNDEKAVKRLLNSQVRYANREDFNNFIKTYDTKYVNSDGLNLDSYSSLIKDLWKSFDGIKYAIEFENIVINDNKAKVELLESTYAELEMAKVYTGELKSLARTIYYLEKKDNSWKVVSDTVLEETTSMLYGNAKDLEINLDVPKQITPNKEYCATLEFEPPEGIVAIASIASDIVEYPQKQTEEVYRAMPEDNILERLFISNNKNANEYVVASLGLTKPTMCDLSVNFNLTGFGYVIKRVNVSDNIEVENVKE